MNRDKKLITTKYPKFELSGPSCKLQNCNGVLIPTTCLKTKDCYQQCTLCGSISNKKSGQEIVNDFIAIINKTNVSK